MQRFNTARIKRHGDQKSAVNSLKSRAEGRVRAEFDRKFDPFCHKGRLWLSKGKFNNLRTGAKQSAYKNCSAK